MVEGEEVARLGQWGDVLMRGLVGGARGDLGGAAAPGGGLVHFCDYGFGGLELGLGLWGGGGAGARAAFEVIEAALEFFAWGLLEGWELGGKKEGCTVVALGDAVLDAATLGEVGDLGPVFVGVGGGGEGTAGAVVGGQAVRCRGSLVVGVGLLRHGGRGEGIRW